MSRTPNLSNEYWITRWRYRRSGAVKTQYRAAATASKWLSGEALSGIIAGDAARLLRGNCRGEDIRLGAVSAR